MKATIFIVAVLRTLHHATEPCSYRSNGVNFVIAYILKTLNQLNAQMYTLDIFITISHLTFLHVFIHKGQSSGNQTKVIVYNQVGHFCTQMAWCKRSNGYNVGIFFGYSFTNVIDLDIQYLGSSLSTGLIFVKHVGCF